MGGTPAILDTYLSNSDTSLEKALKKDLRYRILLSRLDNYKPYPSDTIRNTTQLITGSSISFNNIIIWNAYTPKGESLLEKLSKIHLSEEVIQSLYITIQNTEKSMNNTIDIDCANLRTQVDDYIKQRAK